MPIVPKPSTNAFSHKGVSFDSYEESFNSLTQCELDKKRAEHLNVNNIFVRLYRYITWHVHVQPNASPKELSERKATREFYKALKRLRNNPENIDVVHEFCNAFNTRINYLQKKIKGLTQFGTKCHYHRNSCIKKRPS